MKLHRLSIGTLIGCLSLLSFVALKAQSADATSDKPTDHPTDKSGNVPADPSTKAPASRPSNLDFLAHWGGIVSVKEFGAVGNGEDDDTAAIQAAIDATRSKGGTIYLPPGAYRVSSLNLTNIERGLTLMGGGINATVIHPIRDNVHVLDLTGSLNIRLMNFQIGAYNQTITPKTAIFCAQVASEVSNAMYFENIYISGRYSVAVWYCYAVPSSTAVHCIFYNYINAAVPVVAFTGSNYANVTSDYTKIRTGHDMCSDWTLVGCEIHEMGLPKGRTAATALRLDDTAQMRWVGGNISGAGPQMILLTSQPRYTIFEGTTFYSETGTPAARIFHATDRVDGLTVMQCSPQAAEVIFSGEKKAIYDELHFAGKPTSNGFHGTLFDCPEGELTNSFLHCDGLKLVAEKITDSILIHPGPITARVNEALMTGSAHQHAVTAP